MCIRSNDGNSIELLNFDGSPVLLKRCLSLSWHVSNIKWPIAIRFHSISTVSREKTVRPLPRPCPPLCSLPVLPSPPCPVFSWSRVVLPFSRSFSFFLVLFFSFFLVLSSRSFSFFLVLFRSFSFFLILCFSLFSLFLTIKVVPCDLTGVSQSLRNHIQVWFIYHNCFCGRCDGWKLMRKGCVNASKFTEHETTKTCKNDFWFLLARALLQSKSVSLPMLSLEISS